MKASTVWSLFIVVGGTICTSLLLNMWNQRSTAADDKKGGSIYAQLSSAVTQQVKSGKPLIIGMESNDALGGLTHSDKTKTGDIVVKTPGVYFIMAAAQVGRARGTDSGYVDMWVKQNGKDVDNSNTRQTIPNPNFTAVLVCQGIAECKSGDVINVAISGSSSNAGLGILAIKPKGEPVIPSIILSMYKIN